MTVTPQGQIYLCKTPLENNYKNQLTFSSVTNQYNYFNSTVQHSFDNYTYIKKDNQIKVGLNIDDIIDCNYLFYKNEGFTNKWYYCFITNMEYVNENCTVITFETDVFQTWYFQINYKQCFVEREHVNSDNIGEHTIPENLETGDYIYTDKKDFDYEGFYICVAVSEDILRSNESIIHNSYNGIASGLTYIILKTQNDLNYLIFQYNNDGKIDAISSVFMIPKGYVSNLSWLTDKTGTINYQYVSTQNDVFDLGNITIRRPYMYIGESINNPYRPKNNKLFCYPYCYLEATNNVGVNVVYRFEDFTPLSGNPWYLVKFDAKGVINAGCSIKYIPINYKLQSDATATDEQNFNEGLSGAKLPIGSWINDIYANWLKQNGLNIGINLAGSILQIGAGAGIALLGAGSLLGGGQITSGVSGIANTLGSVYQHSLTPNQAEGNINSSDINYTLNKSGLTLYTKTIKKEYAKAIDDFLTMFGYKVNSLKIPNITGRPYWNYVKTIDCNFDGNIPQTDLSIIRTMFDNGVTLWHGASNMYNYSLDNSLSN